MTFVLAFLAFYYWHMFGITGGYHRILSHKAVKCPKLLEYLIVLGGYLALEGSPVTWVVIHRRHHAVPDLPEDPHTPGVGAWHGYAGWMLTFRYDHRVNPDALAKDLMRDSIYRWLDMGGHLYVAYATCLLVCVTFRLILWYLFGPTVAIASVLAGIVSQQLPLILNMMAHTPSAGYRNFETDDLSVNVWWLAWLTLGEGWHNNHHFAPSSAQFGIRPHEIDVGYMIFRALEKLRLAELRFASSTAAKIVA